MNKPNIKEMSIEQLKALAYDLICGLELNQNNLKVVNEEINKKNMEQTRIQVPPRVTPEIKPAQIIKKEDGNTPEIKQ